MISALTKFTSLSFILMISYYCLIVSSFLAIFGSFSEWNFCVKNNLVHTLHCTPLVLSSLPIPKSASPGKTCFL